MRYLLMILSRREGVGGQVRAGAERGVFQAAVGLLARPAGPPASTRAASRSSPRRPPTTVRVKGGKPVMTDGPFAETKEQLAGYTILEAKNLDEALALRGETPAGLGRLLDRGAADPEQASEVGFVGTRALQRARLRRR